MSEQDTTLETAKENKQSAIGKNVVAHSGFTSHSNSTAQAYFQKLITTDFDIVMPQERCNNCVCV